MTSRVIKMGFADAKVAEKKLNEELKKVKGFVNYQIINNGHHSMVIIFCDEETNSIETPSVKIIEVSITNPEEAEKTINEALKDIEPISLDIATPTDGNRLIVLYDGSAEGDDTP